MSVTQIPRIVVIGAGFGGLAVAKALARAPVALTVVDRRNFHLFQPLLYQVATAALSPADISAPIRTILRRQRNTRVVLGKVIGIDRASRLVLTEDGEIPYDTLVIATGARHSYFGREDWAEIAPGIKTIDDATRVRAKLLVALERAEIETDPARRKALLTFAIVGGGPTGVELAGAISELAHNAATTDFRTITGEDIRVLLIEAGPRVLSTFPEALAEAARAALSAMQVEVRTGAAVTAIEDGRIAVGETIIETQNVIWAAGVRASPAGRWLDAPTDRVGRVKVDPDFALADDRNIFVIGDTACYVSADGKALPGVAPAAKQAGAFVGRLIAARLAGKPAPRRFTYADSGMLATIGRNAAVADLGWIRVSGLAGWLLWSIIHVWFLAGHRNRFSVAFSWAWSYLAWERGARLITGAEIAMADPPPPPAKPEKVSS